MITVRDMREGDCEALSRIVCDVWTMEAYGEDVAMPGSRLYLYSCIAESSYRRVAEIDGEIVGCVAARFGDDSEKVPGLAG